MTLKREIIVLGDIEMGAGNLTDDFISDNALSKLILEVGEREHPIDLVLNGDTFDFLKCPYFDRNRFRYPRHISAEISLGKLNLIYHAHKKVFRALKEFVDNEKNRLYFIIGNHDMDLVYTQVQEKIKKLIENQDNVFFQMKYKQHGVYIEHGHQYDLLNRMNMDKLFLHYKGQNILNLSFVSLSVIAAFLRMKERHPFLERIFPRPTLFSFHQPIKEKLTKKSFGYALKTILYYPFRYYSDPTYNIPKELIRSFYFRWRKVNWDVDNVISSFEGRKERLGKHKIFVLGHVHEKFVQDKKNRVIIHPGSWRDEYELDKKSRKLIPKAKRYVQIKIGEEVEYRLVDVLPKREVLNFEEVVEDEIKYIHRAAKEEGYSSGLI